MHGEVQQSFTSGSFLSKKFIFKEDPNHNFFGFTDGPIFLVRTVNSKCAIDRARHKRILVWTRIHVRSLRVWLGYTLGLLTRGRVQCSTWSQIPTCEVDRRHFACWSHKVHVGIWRTSGATTMPTCEVVINMPSSIWRSCNQQAVGQSSLLWPV